MIAPVRGLLCLKNRGNVWIRASYDKNSYVPGELASVIVEVQNRSSVEVKRFVVKLMQRIHFKDVNGMCSVPVLSRPVPARRVRVCVCAYACQWQLKAVFVSPACASEHILS